MRRDDRECEIQINKQMQSGMHKGVSEADRVSPFHLLTHIDSAMVQNCECGEVQQVHIERDCEQHHRQSYANRVSWIASVQIPKVMICHIL
jgi:hypothetical protein